jgi:hypothetical protein
MEVAFRLGGHAIEFLPKMKVLLLGQRGAAVGILASVFAIFEPRFQVIALDQKSDRGFMSLVHES